MSSTPLYRAKDLRRIETAASDQPLMQRAGLAAAELAVALTKGQGGTVLVLAGPGNNGGDAFEAAHLLRQRFFDTRVVFVGEADSLPKDAAAATAASSTAAARRFPAFPPIRVSRRSSMACSASASSGTSPNPTPTSSSKPTRWLRATPARCWRWTARAVSTPIPAPGRVSALSPVTPSPSSVANRDCSLPMAPITAVRSRSQRWAWMPMSSQVHPVVPWTDRSSPTG